MKLSNFLTEDEAQPEQPAETPTIFKPFNPNDLKTKEEVFKRYDKKKMGEVLFKVIKEGFFDTFKLLMMNGGRSNLKVGPGKKKNPLLVQTIVYKRWEMFDWLLDRYPKIDPDQYDISGNNLLAWFAFEGYDEPMKKLMSKGARIDLLAVGNQPIVLSVGNRKSNTTKTLLKAGADVNTRAQKDFSSVTYDCRWEEKDTLLMIAVRNSDVQMIKLLLSKGADVNLETYDGKVAGGLVKDNEHKDVINQLLLDASKNKK